MNTTLRDWFKLKDGEALSLDILKAKTPEDKVQGYRRVAYQIHEDKSEFCARTYEDAFILANPALFALKGGDHWGDLSFDIAADMGKVETALKYGLSEDAWKVPAYINEGLVWLADSASLPLSPPDPPADGGVAHGT